MAYLLSQSALTAIPNCHVPLMSRSLLWDTCSYQQALWLGTLRDGLPSQQEINLFLFQPAWAKHCFASRSSSFHQFSVFPSHLPFTFLCLPFPTTLTRQCVHSHLHLIPDLLSWLYFSNCVSDRLSGLVFYGSLVKVCFYAWPLQNNHHNYNHNHNNGLLSWEPFLCGRHYAASFTWIILFLFHNSVREVQILFLLYRKGKDLKEFASSPNSMRSLHSGTVFFFLLFFLQNICTLYISLPHTSPLLYKI